MINWLIEVALRNRFIVIALFLFIGAWGYWALLTTPIDAIPDLSDNQVIVFSDWSGRSPQEVEDQITYPLTVSLQGLPGVRVVRSASAFGFSMINVIFEDWVDLYFARSRVFERLQLLSKSLPPGVVPTLGPDATGVGHVFWYTVEGKGQSLRDLRSLQDWFIRYQLNAVPGVAEVASIGGEIRQYQVDVDPNRLRAYKIPLSAVVDAVMRSNRNVGGNVVEASGAWSVVRGLGLIESVKDIEQIVVGAEGGVPIFVRQVADVKIGDAFRVSALLKGRDEAVGGVIVARYGVSTVDVINRVKERIRELEAGLPPGVKIVAFYDRSALIERAVHTLKRALIEEAVVVTLVNVIFLLNLRSILIVTIPLPLAVLVAFLFMRYLGISSNIMSLAGIAIAIGVLVDAAIVVTENAYRFIEKRGINPRNRLRVTETVLEATRLVGRPIFFAMVIIILAFIPVFALTGQEGKLFHPLAFTKTFSMVGATILSVTLVPVLCSLLIGGKIRGEESNPIMRPLVWLYRPVLDFALRHRAITLGIAVLTVAGALALVPKLGKEFMPSLNEGDLMFMPVTDPSISLPPAIGIVRKQHAADLKIPEERAGGVADALRNIPGAADVYAEQVTGAPYLDVRVNRTAAARYGITVGAIQDVIETAVGENNLTLTIEGRQRFPVRVRYAPEYRSDPAALASVLVTAPNGTQVPLGQVAEIRSVSGPSMIGSEHGLLVVTVLLNVRGRDVGSFVEEARRVIAERVALPQGSYIEWSGQYENERRARERLQIVIPLVLIVIFVLLYLTYRSVLDAAQVLLAVPFGLAGGIYLLYALGYNFSVAVWVGFIALFGTAVQTAVVMVIYLEEAVSKKREALDGRLTREALMDAVKEGALLRLRPKVMTVSTVVASLLPIMWSHSTGAEVMKPLATPVLGGMVSSLGLVLIVTPVIFSWLREQDLRRAEREARGHHPNHEPRPAMGPANCRQQGG